MKFAEIIYSRNNRIRIFLICTAALSGLWGCAESKDKMANIAAPVGVSTEKKQEQFVTAYHFGKSAEGRVIKGTVIGNGENVTLLIASIHGDESAGTSLVQKLETHLGRNPELMRGRKAVIISSVNPDGVIRGTRENANRVDINHDFSSDQPQPETLSIMQAIKYFSPDRIISIRQLGGIDFDGPGSEDLAGHLRQQCDLRIRRWGTTPGSLGNYGTGKGIPVITFGLPVKNMGAEHLWAEYREAMLAAVTYGSPVFTGSVPPPAVKTVAKPAADEIQAAVERSGRLIRHKKYSEAADLLRDPIEKDPDNPVLRKNLHEAYMGWGNVLMRQKDYAQAADRYEKACSYDEKDECRKKRGECLAVVHYEQARTFERSGNRENAAEEYAEVLKNDPNFRDAQQRLAKIRGNRSEELFQSGIQHMNAQQPAEALSLFEKLRDSDPSYKKDEVARYIQYAKDFIKAEKEVRQYQSNPN